MLDFKDCSLIGHQLLARQEQEVSCPKFAKCCKRYEFWLLEHNRAAGADLCQLHKVWTTIWPPRGKTDYADHKILKLTAKSGLTPLSPGMYSHSPATPTERRRRKKADRLRKYQRDQLRGFTSQKLLGLQTLSSMDTTKMGQRLASVPLHPLVSLHRWYRGNELPRNQGDIPIWGENKGFWTVSSVLKSLLLVTSQTTTVLGA